MLTVRLAGGLGNQIFQLAAALHLRAQYTSICLLTAALSRYKAVRQPDLLRLIDTTTLGIQAETDTGLLERLQVVGRAGRWFAGLAINDRNVATIPPRSRHRGWMDGYFQDFWSPLAFASVCSQLRSALQLSRLDKDSAPEFAIHVRGGDLLRDTDLIVVDASWYAQRLQEAANVEPIRRIHLITDDTNHAGKVLAMLREALPRTVFELINTGDALDDFNVLRCARRRLVGNSTFALWASALDEAAAPTICPALLGLGRPRRTALPWETLF